MTPRASTSSRKKQRVASSDSEAESASDSDAPSANKKQKSKGKGKKATAEKSKSKGKGKKKQQDSSDEEEDEDDSDAGVGVGKKGALTERDRKDLVSAMTRHILFTEYTRKLHPRKTMTEAVLTEAHTKKRFNDVIPGVQKTLRELLGMELVKMRPKETSNAKNPAAVYVLRSTLPIELIRAATLLSHEDLAAEVDEDLAATSKLARELAQWEADGEQLPGAGETKGAPMRDVKREEGGLYGLLGVILGLILVNSKVLGDDQLITHLRKLHLIPSTILPQSMASASHPAGLTLAKYIDLLVAQGYIERGPSAAAPATKGRMQATQRTQRGSGSDRIEGGDAAIQYTWGARAEVEIGEQGIADWMKTVWFSKSGGGNGGGSDAEDGSQGQSQRKKGKTGEKWSSEIARAAGTAKLESADEIKVTL